MASPEQVAKLRAAIETVVAFHTRYSPDYGVVVVTRATNYENHKRIQEAWEVLASVAAGRQP